eukprot:CAMPEP_0179341664 /NCGR_PEP_ID=MMETSP0797-20121207/69968_1 /TAXON_ID=47934 /ORGANISM="Dinophysis acuminata, Strain DAEP01" /LENGTH=401 /DNA_ID=CAMNT_0021055775 /DNA_START=171 /DNA_END=1372 /DNA_ORIENTATION=+
MAGMADCMHLSAQLAPAILIRCPPAEIHPGPGQCRGCKKLQARPRVTSLAIDRRAIGGGNRRGNRASGRTNEHRLSNQPALEALLRLLDVVDRELVVAGGLAQVDLVGPAQLRPGRDQVGVVVDQDGVPEAAALLVHPLDAVGLAAEAVGGDPPPGVDVDAAGVAPLDLQLRHRLPPPRAAGRAAPRSLLADQRPLALDVLHGVQGAVDRVEVRAQLRVDHGVQDEDRAVRVVGHDDHLPPGRLLVEPRADGLEQVPEVVQALALVVHLLLEEVRVGDGGGLPLPVVERRPQVVLHALLRVPPLVELLPQLLRRQPLGSEAAAVGVPALARLAVQDSPGVDLGLPPGDVVVDGGVEGLQRERPVVVEDDQARGGPVAVGGREQAAEHLPVDPVRARAAPLA